MQKSRQSRRSSCDRCRVYKLRCDRVPTQGNSCQRCLKNGTSCHMTGEEPEEVMIGRNSYDVFANPHMNQSGAPIRSLPTDQPEMGSPVSRNPIDLNLIGSFESANRDNTSNIIHGQRIGGTESHLLTPPLDEMTNSVDTPQNTLQMLFQLCSKMASNQSVSRIGDCNSTFVDTEIERVLGWTSRFSEILTNVATSKMDSYLGQYQPQTGEQAGTTIDDTFLTSFLSRSPQTVEGTLGLTGSAPYRAGLPHERAGTERQNSDIILTTTLVTTYILLLRTWRRIFHDLHHLLQGADRCEISKPIILPSLQLGGFHVQSNPKVQIKVLLELSSGMLRGVETCLGISDQANSQRNGDAAQNEPIVPVLRMDPVAVSIRETLISQDFLKTTGQDGYDEPSLTKMMEKVSGQISKW